MPARRYQEGKRWIHHMKATNDGRRYEIDARGVVKEGRARSMVRRVRLVEPRLQWRAVQPASIEAWNSARCFPLDVRKMPRLPKLATVHPMLIGPVTDLMTFYVDLWLAERVANLSKAGNHLLFKRGVPSSWADGKYVTLGEDSIDFDITLTELDTARQVGTLLVRHVPPQKPQITVPAEWMREPVADTPNNWVEVARRDGKYIAAVGAGDLRRPALGQPDGRPHPLREH